MKSLTRNVTSVIRKRNNVPRNSVCSLSYVQGQSSAENEREYFYYIDHQGMLFLDDAKVKNFTSCYKEKDFLKLFYTCLRMNTDGKYLSEFPYRSRCFREMNYVRCDDRPIVYTHVVTPPGGCGDFLAYGNAGDLLKVQFEPQKLCMFPETGRVYYPAFDRTGGVGLVKSSLAMEFSRAFRFEDGDAQPPTQFCWRGNTYRLTNELV